MSELEPRSRFFTSDQQYDFLPTTPPLDDLMYTDQLISNPSPKFRQRSCEEANSFPAIQSRDHSHTATPTISYPCVAWGCSDFSTTGNGLLDTIGTGFTNFTGFATPFPPANDFQSWITQQPPGVDDWGSILDPRFVPELDINPARSIDDL
jgi:hypothetical protein